MKNFVLHIDDTGQSQHDNMRATAKIFSAVIVLLSLLFSVNRALRLLRWDNLCRQVIVILLVNISLHRITSC
jgi:hypothetical protein